MANSYYEEIILKNQQTPFIFHTDTPQKHLTPPNWHENMEILYCISGTGKIKCDDEEYELNKGEIFVIETNMLHSPYSLTEDFTYRCLIIDKFFMEENGLSIENVHFPRIISDKEMNKSFEKLVEAFYSKNRYKGTYIRLSVLGFLLNMYEKYSVVYSEDTVNKNRENIERIKNVIIYLKRNYAKKITLDDVADNSKTSKFHLAREFKQITGHTIFEFLNLIRCKEAKRLIREGRSVSDAAFSCGFENMSYFTRTYKKITGKLPSGEKTKS